MPFTSEAQRKAVMARLKKHGFKADKVDVKGKHFRFRQEPPGRFQKGTFRTKDVGRKGYMKLITARPKGKTTTRVQSVLLSRGAQ